MVDVLFFGDQTSKPESKFYQLIVKGSCAIRMISDSFRFLFINVYMPYESGDDMTNDFTDQLLTVEELVNHGYCHVIMGGDFNVDLSRDRLHTELLNSFCVNLGLHALMRHNRCTIDYSYNFNMDRFKVLDHFLLSSTVFENLIYRLCIRCS